MHLISGFSWMIKRHFFFAALCPQSTFPAIKSLISSSPTMCPFVSLHRHILYDVVWWSLQVLGQHHTHAHTHTPQPAPAVRLDQPPSCPTTPAALCHIEVSWTEKGFILNDAESPNVVTEDLLWIFFLTKSHTSDQLPVLVWTFVKILLYNNKSDSFFFICTMQNFTELVWEHLAVFLFPIR